MEYSEDSTNENLEGILTVKEKGTQTISIKSAINAKELFKLKKVIHITSVLVKKKEIKSNKNKK